MQSAKLAKDILGVYRTSILAFWNGPVNALYPFKVWKGEASNEVVFVEQDRLAAYALRIKSKTKSP